MVNPDITVPQWTGHRHLHTHNMWDGARWPATYQLSQHPTTIRAILPALALRTIEGRSTESEKSQLRDLRVWDVKNRISLLPSPHHCAQWLGVPETHATHVLGPNVPCERIIDDLLGEDQTHWQQFADDCRPPATRMSQCRIRQWCKECAKLVSIIGNGWHVTAATMLTESVIRQAVKAKMGQPAQQLDYGIHPYHQCTWECRLRMRLGDVKKLAKEQRKTTMKTGTGSTDIIDI